MKQALVVVLSITLAAGATAAMEENRMKHVTQKKDAEALLSDWQAAHMVIAFNRGRPYWFVDSANAFEGDWTKRIMPLLLISRNDGHVLERSPLYRSLGFPIPPAANSGPRIWTVGNRYIFCTGPIQEPEGKTYQLTIGKRL